LIGARTAPKIDCKSNGHRENQPTELDDPALGEHMHLSSHKDDLARRWFSRRLLFNAPETLDRQLDWCANGVGCQTL